MTALAPLAAPPRGRHRAARTALAMVLLCAYAGGAPSARAQPASAEMAAQIERVVEFRRGEACTPRADFTVEGVGFGQAQGARQIRLSHAANPRAEPGPRLEVLGWSERAIRLAYPADQELDLSHRHYVGIYAPDGAMASNLVPVEFCRPVLPAVTVPPPLPSELPGQSMDPLP